MKLLLVLLFAGCAAALAGNTFEEKDDSAEMRSEKILKKIAVLEELLESGADEDMLLDELKEAMQENAGGDFLPEEYNDKMDILKELYGKLEERVGEKGIPHRGKGYPQGRDSRPELWDRLDENDAPFVR